MSIVRNRVLLTLAAVAALAMVLGGLVGHAPNRLVSGQPLALWDVSHGLILTAVAGAWIALLVAAFAPRRPLVNWSVVGLAALWVLLILLAAGQAADSLAAVSNPVARTSLGAAFWIAIVCGALMIADALQRLEAKPVWRIAVVTLLAAAVAAMALAGSFDALSVVQEYGHRRAAFVQEFVRHCVLAASAIGAALLIGVPLGIAVARRPAAGGPVFATLNLVQTIPSLAFFGLLIGPLSALGKAIPALGAAGIGGIGFAPAVIALVLYSLLPMVRNTHAGIAGIDRAVIETATGMGFTPRQILWKVQLPLALPILLAGLRIVTVQAIGLTVVAALVGAGGLGTFVFQGLGQYAADLVLLGAIPAILLALAADFLLRSLSASLRRGSPA